MLKGKAKLRIFLIGMINKNWFLLKLGEQLCLSLLNKKKKMRLCNLRCFNVPRACIHDVKMLIIFNFILHCLIINLYDKTQEINLLVYVSKTKITKWVISLTTSDISKNVFSVQCPPTGKIFPELFWCNKNWTSLLFPLVNDWQNIIISGNHFPC
jgi:hypothetical protein